MTKISSASAVVIAALFTLMTHIAAHADTFGSGNNTFTIDFVEIGDAGNAADTTTYGAVLYDYRVGNFKRSGQETGKFLVNTVAGVGGLMQPAEKIPALANVPAADTGQTFAKWGIGHGPYLVLPILGPTTIRDGVGLAGDFALNPVSWVTIIYGEFVWTIAIPAANTMRSLPNQLAQYDAAVENAVDPYLSARTAYIQYRAGVEAK